MLFSISPLLFGRRWLCFLRQGLKPPPEAKQRSSQGREATDFLEAPIDLDLDDKPGCGVFAVIRRNEAILAGRATEACATMLQACRMTVTACWTKTRPVGCVAALLRTKPGCGTMLEACRMTVTTCWTKTRPPGCVAALFRTTSCNHRSGFMFWLGQRA